MTDISSRVANFADRMFLVLQLVVQVVLLAMIIVRLTEWWGISYVPVVLPVALFIVVFVVSYRFIRGKWPSFLATVLGSLAGYTAVFLVFPWILAFPILYRFVEGEWPVTYLCLMAVLLVVSPVKEFLYKKNRNANSVY